jgi:hypothetical protein
MDEVEKIHVANPYKVRAIALGQDQGCGLIPAVHLPSKEVLRQSMFLVEMGFPILVSLSFLIFGIFFWLGI